MKKQSVAYALALLLGATSVFGGAVLPSFEQDAAVVQAASPSVAQTNNPLRSASETTVTTVDDLNTALENGGEIKIDADIDSNTTFTVKEDSILNLNGHKISSYFLNVAEGKKLEITGTGDYEGIIEVGEYAGNPGTLILSDGNVQRIDVFSGSTFVMDGGIVNGCDVNISANSSFTMNNGTINNGEVCVLASGSIFTMKGGKITGSSGGVDVSKGTFNLEGGVISQNTKCGVDIYDGGTFYMTGGTITQNDKGGVDVGKNSTFTMTDGSISNNGDTGVYVTSEGATFNLSGGSIKNNYAKTYREFGGGVWITDTTFNLSGSPIITGNKNDFNETENLLLSSSANAKINITGALKDGCNIGVYSSKTGDFTKNYATHNGTTDPTKYFSSDQSNYSVSRNAATGEAQLVKTSSSSSSSSSSNTTARNTTASRNTSSSSSSARSSSSSSSDDDDDSSSSKSFSDGGTKTGGSGSAKGDYKKAGKTGAKYTMAEISDKATTAKVPATVKIGKKTYNVTAISSDAFIGYSNLKTVTIGKNIKKIGKSAFSGCSSLKTLTIHSKKLTAKNIQGALKGSAVKTVYVPADKVQAYKKIFTKKNTGSKNKISVKAIKS